MSKTKLNPTNGYPQNGADQASQPETRAFAAHDECPQCAGNGGWDDLRKQDFAWVECRHCKGTGHVESESERSGADNH